MPRTMHLLNSLGHLTIHWEVQNDELVLPVIQSMLDQQFKFFILSESGDVEVTSIDDLGGRQVKILDETLNALADLQKLQEAGQVQVGGVSIDDEAETTGELATTPEAVAAHDTIAVQPARGG